MSGDYTVLVVEDEEPLADLYTNWLSDRYTVLTAYTAGEALEKVDDTVDVVLLDRRLPDRSGGEILEGIRDRGLDCRVAMVTAVDPDFDIVDMGFDDYLVKPATREDLYETVDRLLDRTTYDATLREISSLAAKRAVLEAEKTEAELATSAEYTDLCDRLEALRAEVEDAREAFDSDDYRVLFRDLEPSGDDGNA